MVSQAMLELLQLFRFRCLKNYMFEVVKQSLDPKVYQFLCNNRQMADEVSSIDLKVK